MSEFSLHPQLAKDCFFVKDLSLSRLLLMNDKNYPWCILVPMRGAPDRYITDIYQLTESEQVQLINESSRLSRVMMGLFAGKKMNVAALGNVVPQLHIHHIVRKQGDPCWPKPVWGQVPTVFYRDAEEQQLIAVLKQRL